MSSPEFTVGLAVLTLLAVRFAVSGELAGRGPPARGARRHRPGKWGPTPAATSPESPVVEERDHAREVGRPVWDFADGPERPGFDHGDDPMLTDAERVEQALADAGGQLRQQELLGRSGWTKARMSRLLSYMADAGTVVKIRVGRENVVCLEDAVPAILRDTDDEQDASATTEGTTERSIRGSGGHEPGDGDESP